MEGLGRNTIEFFLYIKYILTQRDVLMMFSLKKQNKTKVGKPPGTISYTGEKTEEPVEITFIQYDKIDYSKTKLQNIEEFIKLRDPKKNNWIILDGIHQIESIESLGKNLDIHPLIMEDIVNIYERVKVEFYENFVFLILKEFIIDDEGALKENHICLLYYPELIITFLDNKTNAFNHILARIEGNRGRIREFGTDYLFYCIIDNIVDNYFLTLESLSERIEDTEEDLVKNPNEEHLFSIHKLKSDIVQIRKNILPFREIINSIIRGDSKLVKETNNIYFRDIYDHIIRIIETLESDREMVSGLLDIYLSSTSNKMNEVMKILTIIATIFIPLTFIAGVYGMNFVEDMPAFRWEYSYIIVWIVMVVITIGMIFYFRRKKWI